MNAITNVMIGILNFINQFTGNYGWSIVIFTLLFRLVLSPVDIRSRIGMRVYARKNAKLQPQIDLINKTYKDDQQKAMMKASELRKKEGVGMMPPGCGAMLLTYPILLAFFAVFRNMAAYQIIGDTSLGITGLANVVGDHTAVAQWFDVNGFLWIKNIWQPDVAYDMKNVFLLHLLFPSGTPSTMVPQGSYIFTVMSSLANVFGDSGFSVADAVAQVTPALNELAKALPYTNGYFILPVLAGVSQFITIKLTPNTAQTQTQTGPQAEQSAKMNKFMQNFFPILFVYFCLISSSALAIYWITSNLLMLVLNLSVNKYMDKKEAREAAKEKGV